MTELQKWQAVNQCESVQGLGFLIQSFADKDGMIQGRERKFDALTMAINLDHYISSQAPANVLTREYGIRQQAIYLKSFIL